MASTVLPNGIIIPEKFSRDWYADLYHNWQELDNLLGGGTPKDGTLTIQKNGTTVGTFSANQATDETVNIEVPDVNNGTLTIQQNGTTVDTFTANSSSDKTVNIQCVDLTNNQTIGGDKEFTGTTTAHDVIPSATDTYNFGSPSYQWNNAYIKSLTINGVACGDILTHNVSEFVSVSGDQTIGGIKTFSFGGCTFFKQIKINHNLEYGENNPPSQSAYHNLMFTDASGWWGSYIENVTDTNGNSTLAFYVRNTNEIQSRVYLKCDINGSFSMYPLSNNVWNLGTSTNKWKSFNGINPGALSLPGNYINVDTTNWVLDGSAVNVFTPTSDGWLGIQATDTVYDQMHYVFAGRNDTPSYHSQNMLSPINGLWLGSYHGCVFIPVIKNTRYDIRCICSSVVATFYPCQGNV